MILELFIPNAIHPSLNKWTKWHWGKIAKEKEMWKWLIVEAISSRYGFIRPIPLTFPLKVIITHYFPTKAKHDIDNYTPKLIMDSLKGLVIADDNYSIVRSLETRFQYCKEQPGTLIQIEKL